MYFSTQSSVTPGGSLLLLASPGSWDPVDQSFIVPEGGVYNVQANTYLTSCNLTSLTATLYANISIYVRDIATSTLNQKSIIVNGGIVTPGSTQSSGIILGTFFAKTGDRIYIAYSFGNSPTVNTYCTGVNPSIHSLNINKVN